LLEYLRQPILGQENSGLYPVPPKPEFKPFTINGRHIASRADAFQDSSPEFNM
jgi:hypothetical protein